MKSMEITPIDEATPRGHLTRREAFTGAILAMWGVIAACLGVPALAYLFVPARTRKADPWVEAGGLSALSANRRRRQISQESVRLLADQKLQKSGSQGSGLGLKHDREPKTPVAVGDATSIATDVRGSAATGVANNEAVTAIFVFGVL